MAQKRVKDPKADLKMKYKKVLEFSICIALVLLIFTFYAFKKFDIATKLPEHADIKIEMLEIPPTQQLQRPPPPSRPMIPIETEDDDLLDDVTIEETEIVFEARDDAPPPPPPEDDEVFEFFAVSEKPDIIKKHTPVYPDLARKAQIEGKVVITVTIGKDGHVEKAIVFKSVPMLDEAALSAARLCVFKPAKQRDKFVRVRMNVPFDFKLR
jgi:protein TonB